MRFKKGFTLAEILIVLMVIGALATMTIPSLMKGVSEAQFKTAYRKALNAIVNLTTMEKLSGNLPSITNTDGANKLFDILTGSLSVKAYTDKVGFSKGSTVAVSDYSSSAGTDENRYKNWIITEDNIAYLVVQTSHDATACNTKMQLNAAQENENSPFTQNGENTSGKSTDPMGANACYIIYVDVNGLSAGPNTVATNTLKASEKVPELAYDTYPIYIALDGATAGNQKTTITGRIAADMK